jgi:Ohr subfamily peroxiredoxin
MKILYEAHATVQGGRNGHVRTDDGIIDLQLAVPKSMGGPGGEKSNPEQLFASGYAACFDGALNYIASTKKIRLTGTRVDATVGIGAIEPVGFGLQVKLEITIPELDRGIALELVQETHKFCPYSNAIRGNVDVELVLV